MNCKNTQSLLSAYLDEELAGKEMLDIREHLGQCEECSLELQCVEAVKRMLGGTAVPEPSPDFEERLVSRVLSATAVQTEPRKISILALTGIAAASMLGTLVLLNSLPKQQSSAALESQETTPYELIQNDRSFGASMDPMVGSPVVLNRR